MEIIRTENLSFAYPMRENKALNNINISVKKGEFITICGKSGCGKTTLLRLLKSSLAPHGDLKGNVYFEGKELCEANSREQAQKIGFVMQSPENQIVTDKVWHELSFGLESLGVSTPEIRARVAEISSFFGIHNWFHKKVTELSGGEKQLLNLASVMVMAPSVLILDEPTSQLDPISAGEFLKTLEKINRELGTTVILSEHRLEDAFTISDRVIVMDGGEIIADDIPNNVGKILNSQKHPMRFALPTPMRVFGAIENTADCPITVREGRQWLEGYLKNHPANPQLIPQGKGVETETVIEIKDAYFRYKKDLPDVIKGLNVKIRKGELFAILGGNGTGKTTALSLMSGLNTAYRGDIIIKGESIAKAENLYNGIIGVLPQNPQSVFVKNTVELDLMEMLSETELSENEKKSRVKDIASLCRIDDLLSVHPYDLSGGEGQRTALAKVLLMNPEILLLDEPTKGLDSHFKKIFAEIIDSLKLNGVTIVMVSHDIEFCAEYADRCALFFDGNITSCGKPREFFVGKNFYTTSANRMARTTIPQAVTADDIILALGGEPQRWDDEPKPMVFEISRYEPPKPKKKEYAKADTKLSKSTLATIFLILLAIPLTLYTGIFFLGDRKYYFTSLLIILETMIPFILAFEKRKPQARELVVISVLCAIAVMGRAVFFMLPQFKPVVAIIVISGVCFGGEVGFLAGGITGFVSGFFAGQGPWTPWQMFALGIIGFISGILFKKGFLKRSRATLCIFGFIATFLIYGGIMNPASVIMWQNTITKEMIISAYAMGFTFDMIHSLATAFFLWFISEPMIDKLERVKVKYGILTTHF